MIARDRRSYQVGPYTVRRDPGVGDTWRVFSGSVAIFHAPTCGEALDHVRGRVDDRAMTVACPLCHSPAGQRCALVGDPERRAKWAPHIARVETWLKGR